MGLLIICYTLSVAQSLQFKHLDVEDGLPSSQVFCAFQDNDGYMWFTTDNGVSRFDGYAFKNFSTKDGLAANTVLTGIVLNNNNILFHTLSSGLFWYKNGAFEEIKSQEYKELVHKKNIIVVRYTVDRNNTVWFTTNEFNTYYSLDTTEKLTQHHGPPIGTNPMLRGSFLIDLGNSFLPSLKANKRLITSAPKSYSPPTTFFPSIMVKNVRKLDTCFFLLLEKDDSTKNNIFFITNEKKLITKKLIINDTNPFFTYVFSDNEKDIWLGSESGVYLFENGDFNAPYVHILKEYYITYINQDDEGNIWITTKDDGVFLITGKNIKNYLTNQKVIAFSQHANHLWATTVTGRVVKIDSNSKITEVLNKKTKNNIATFLVSKKGVFIHETLHDFNNKISVSLNNFLNTKKIVCIGDSLYFIANHMGINAVKPPSDEVKSGLSVQHRTNGLLFEPPSQLLLGTTKGLFSYNIHTKTTTDIRKGNPLLSERIMDIKKWGNSYLLATKGQGLVIYNNDTVFALSTKEGLKSNIIHCSTAENGNTIWAGSNSGVSKIVFVPNTFILKTVTNYTNIDGLASNEVKDLAYFNNKIWVATMKGISCFLPQKDSTYSITPKLKIQTLLINNSPVVTTDNLILKPHENNLLINYLGISYKTLGQITYRYRLNGYANEWVLTKNISANFTNIPAGNYVFELQAINKDGIWSPSKKIQIFIAQHFTQKLWFIILVIIILISIPSGIVFNILKSKREKEKQKRKALEAELFALRNQISPHFVFNALNAIQSYNVKTRDREAINYLSNFSDLMRQILENAKHSFISIEDEIDCITNYLNLEKLRTNNRFTYTITVGENINKMYTFIPPMFLQPHLENAIWKGFTKEIPAPHIDINFTINGNSLSINIIDNGIGINNGADSRTQNTSVKGYQSTGIKNIQSRIAHIKQLHDIDISLNIYDLSEKVLGQTGTEVCYTISLLTKRPTSID